MKKMKIILLCIFLSLNTFVYSQSISNVKTAYSQNENETIGKESFTFSLYNSYINITDNDYNRKTKYGPLYLDNSGYKDGFYYLFYRPDIKADPLSFANGKKLKAYRFLSKTKGSNILRIEEMVIRNKQVSVKSYYTNEGYNSINTGNENQRVKANFDIRDLIINSKSLTDLMGRVNFSFEQKGDKKTSDDGQSITVTYVNESNVKPLVTYTKSGKVLQIIFLVPEVDGNKVIKELISKYGTKEVYGEELIIRGNLTYDYRVNGKVGIIIIK